MFDFVIVTSNKKMGIEVLRKSVENIEHAIFITVKQTM